MEPSNATGGAAIADRLRLDIPDPNAKKGSDKGSTAAVIVGLVALAVAGVVAFMLYNHLQFLQNA